MTPEEIAEIEATVAKKEKGFIEKVGASALISIAIASAAVVSSFTLVQYKTGQNVDAMKDLKTQVEQLAREKTEDGKSISVMTEQIRVLNLSINELKDQNKEIYRLVLDISKP